MEKRTSDFKFYHYDPTIIGANIFIILFLFLLPTFLHVYQLSRTRTWFMIPFVIGGFCTSWLFHLSFFLPINKQPSIIHQTHTHTHSLSLFPSLPFPSPHITSLPIYLLTCKTPNCRMDRLHRPPNQPHPNPQLDTRTVPNPDPPPRRRAGLIRSVDLHDPGSDHRPHGRGIVFFHPQEVVDEDFCGGGCYIVPSSGGGMSCFSFFFFLLLLSFSSFFLTCFLTYAMPRQLKVERDRERD